MGVSNKTVVIVNNGGPAPRERKRPKTSLFLSTKFKVPFREQGEYISWKMFFCLRLVLWGGLSSHAEGIFSKRRLCGLSTTKRKEEQRRSRRTITKNEKMRRCRSADLPCLGSVIVSTGPSHFISNLWKCRRVQHPTQFSGFSPWWRKPLLRDWISSFWKISDLVPFYGRVPVALSLIVFS